MNLCRVASGNESGVEAMRQLYNTRMADSAAENRLSSPPEDIEDEYLPKKPLAPKVKIGAPSASRHAMIQAASFCLRANEHLGRLLAFPSARVFLI